MSTAVPRRHFLRTLTGSGLCLDALAFPFAGKLPSVGAQESLPSVGSVRFSAEMEPLVRLLEETPREALLEQIGAGIRKGTLTYRQVLTALLLAGVRNIQPRPVGFKFHAVLVVHSAHLASLNAPDSDRWLPLFWALDQFKSSQARDVAEGDWTLSALEEKRVPEAGSAVREFTDAMDGWDVARTDPAVAGLVRSAGAQEVFDRFCWYGARDFRDIGHKAIYAANSWRALQTMGWEHAEPVLRSLAYAMLEHEDGNPQDRDATADAPGRYNQVLLQKIRPDWTTGRSLPDALPALQSVLRNGDWKAAADAVVEWLNRGAAPQVVWDACYQSAMEFLMRKPGIVALHAVTTTNALHYAWQNCHTDSTRRFLLLQNASFLTLFREAAGAGSGLQLDQLEPQPGTVSLGSIFASAGQDAGAAARQTLAWLQQGGSPRDFIAAAQRLIYLKGTDSHDYKFSAAVFEDAAHLSPEHRHHFLAASLFHLRGDGGPDNPLVQRTREALRM